MYYGTPYRSVRRVLLRLIIPFFFGDVFFRSISYDPRQRYFLSSCDCSKTPVDTAREAHRCAHRTGFSCLNVGFLSVLCL